MPYRPPKKQPQFADLKGILAQSKNEVDNALYQTVQEIIERLSQFKDVLNEQISAIDPSSILPNVASKFATYHTKEFEVAVLPNSWQLLAGTNITFDDSVPNKRTINATGGGGGGSSNHYDAPLTDGDLVATDLIFANGECIIVQVPI